MTRRPQFKIPDVSQFKLEQRPSEEDSEADDMIGQLLLNKKFKPMIPLPKIKESDLEEREAEQYEKFLKQFLSGTLNIKGEKEYQFTDKNLIDIEHLGHGSFGTVRKMRHTETQREMAVKRVRIVSNSLDEMGVNRSMKRLKQEVDVIKSSDSVFIVSFYGLTFHDGDAWVCMELMDISLEHLYTTVKKLEHDKFDEDTLGCVAISTIQALIHLKDYHHIIHRDIKPSNILLNSDGRVKLCDFGICGYLQDSVAMSRDAGCRPYMAPERLSTASRHYDIRSEVWSLGVSMVEVANFAFPYPEFLNAPVFKQLQMVIYGDPPMVINPKYSIMTRNFINLCVTKDLSLRPTFIQLKNTPYYQNYLTKENLHEVVAVYVREMLPHRSKFKATEASVA